MVDSIKSKLNGNIWKVATTTLISIVLILGSLGYAAIMNKLDRIETIAMENQRKVERYDERIKNNKSEIDRLRDEREKRGNP